MNANGQAILDQIPIGKEFWIIASDDVDKVDSLSKVFRITKGILVNVKVFTDETIDGESVKCTKPKAKFKICHMKDVDGESSLFYCWQEKLYHSKEEAENAFLELLEDMAQENGLFLAKE